GQKAQVWRQHVDGREHTAHHRHRHDEEDVEDVELLEILRPQPDDDAEQAENERHRRHPEQELGDVPDRGHAEARPDGEDAERRDDRADDDAGQHADDHLDIGERRHQRLLDEAQEALEIDRRGRLQEGGVDDVHHQDAGQHELQIAVPADLLDAPAQHEAEDEDEQQRADPRRYEGLDRHAHDARDFAPHDGAEPDPVDAQGG